MTELELVTRDNIFVGMRVRGIDDDYPEHSEHHIYDGVIEGIWEDTYEQPRCDFRRDDAIGGSGRLGTWASWYDEDKGYFCASCNDGKLYCLDDSAHLMYNKKAKLTIKEFINKRNNE